MANEYPYASARAHALQLDIISLTGALWSGEIRQVSVPGSAGRFGVMARHLPLLATLSEGMLHIWPVGEQPLQIYICGGYVEVQPDKVLVMADLAARSADVDEGRAEAARARVTAPLAENLTDAAYAQIHMELIHRYSANLHYTSRPWPSRGGI